MPHNSLSDCWTWLKMQCLELLQPSWDHEDSSQDTEGGRMRLEDRIWCVWLLNCWIIPTSALPDAWDNTPPCCLTLWVGLLLLVAGSILTMTLHVVEQFLPGRGWHELWRTSLISRSCCPDLSPLTLGLLIRMMILAWVNRNSDLGHHLNKLVGTTKDAIVAMPNIS